jgi:hypothetical protein
MAATEEEPMARRGWWLGGLLLAVVACAHAPPPTVVADGFTLNAEAWSDLQGELSRRASFELDCPVADLQFTVIHTGQHTYDDQASEVGVRGCGRRVLYLRDRRGPSGWVSEGCGGP